MYFTSCHLILCWVRNVSHLWIMKALYWEKTNGITPEYPTHPTVSGLGLGLRLGLGIRVGD